MSDNINLLVTYTIKGNKRQEFLAAVNQIDLVRKTRKETGNKEYRYLLPIDNYAQKAGRTRNASTDTARRSILRSLSK